MHLYFHESEIGKNFPLSYCGIKKYTYLCTRNGERCHSSVGRAKDWKSLCPRFDSWWHHFLKQSECSAVGSALRSGRRGRAFESPHSDKVKGSFLEYSKLPFIIFRLSGRNRNSRTEIYQPIISWRTDSTFWRQQHSLCCVSVAQRLKWLILRMRRQSLRLSWVGVPGMLSE